MEQAHSVPVLEPQPATAGLVRRCNEINLLIVITPFKAI